MNEQEIVKTCLTEILKRNGYHHPDNLTQRDFDHMSQEIDRATGILISGTTIKRLLSGKFSRLPQIATLDAVSRYLGFKNWQEYKAASLPVDAPAYMDAPVMLPKETTWLSKYRKIALLGFILMAIIVGAFVQLSQRPGNFEKASFAFKKITANDIPNTVVFNYNVDDVTADSFFIQQSWDKNRRVKISKKTYTLTDIYYEPGYHIAKLIANDSVIKAVDVSIPTDGWFYFAKDHPSAKPEYIRRKAAQSPADVGLHLQDLLASHIDVTKEKEYACQFFPSKLTVDSDDFSFKTTLRMKEVRSNFCPYISFEIFTQRYPFFLKIMPRGCVNESLLQLGERFFSGKTTDLDFLGWDVRQKTELELRVTKRRVKIYIDRREVYSGAYQSGSKRITGLGIMSNGLCEFENIELKGADGTTVYATEGGFSL